MVQRRLGQNHLQEILFFNFRPFGMVQRRLGHYHQLLDTTLLLLCWQPVQRWAGNGGLESGGADPASAPGTDVASTDIDVLLWSVAIEAGEFEDSLGKR